MCATCGCGVEDVHEHDEAHGHAHAHQDGHERTIELERRVLEKNDRLAEGNRARLAAARIFALNLLSSPGSGKTTLLERTVRDVGGELGASVIEGDQASSRDADRIAAAGGRALQINTGAVCHLDAHMVAHAIDDLRPEPGSVLFLENVGNLVCPALFDLGERARVVLASVAEGDDKPLKYPHMFRRCDLLLVTKIDLLPHVGEFDVDRLVGAARQLNPRLEALRVSARTGEGLEAWYGWIRRRRAEVVA